MLQTSSCSHCSTTGQRGTGHTYNIKALYACYRPAHAATAAMQGSRVLGAPTW
jgi:hypothetical protein